MQQLTSLPKIAVGLPYSLLVVEVIKENKFKTKQIILSNDTDR